MHFLCRADGSEAARTGWFCSDLGGEELLVLPSLHSPQTV
jgi:hypothetical protein